MFAVDPAGFRPGRACSSNAITPAAMAVAGLVPLDVT
jgi:hypothetical protein